MEKRDIAVTVQNFVQFYSIKKGIDELIKRNYKVDIYIPHTDDASGIGKMYDETYNELINTNYSLKRNTDKNLSYKVLLEPYPMDIFLKFNFDYRLKYKYSLLSAKPNLVYRPEDNIYYDAILCYSPYDANFLNVYSKTELIGNLKYINFKRNPEHSVKPILLYLPTYGDVSSIDSIIKQLDKLKDKYYLVTKLHHGTSSLVNEAERIEKLKNISDECYNHTTELAKLLEKADVVLSDNSGAIFETLYAQVPLAIFSENINKNKLGNLDTTQYKLVQENYIPYTNDVNQIENVLELAMSNEYIVKQKELSNNLFYRPESPVKEFADLIEKYLTNNVDLTFKQVHDVLVNDYVTKIEHINELQTTLANSNTDYNQLQSILNGKNLQIQNLENNIKEKDCIIMYYETGKLYKISKKIYNLYFKIFKRSKK